MRFMLLIALPLAACANPALERMQAACDAGDTDACRVVLEHRRAAVGALLAPPPEPVYTPPVMQSSPPSNTFIQCIPTIGGGMNCTGY